MRTQVINEQEKEENISMGVNRKETLLSLHGLLSQSRLELAFKTLVLFPNLLLRVGFLFIPNNGYKVSLFIFQLP